MSYITNEIAVARYLHDSVSGGAFRRSRAGSLYVSPEGALIYERKTASRRREYGPVTLVERHGKVFVINGDGLSDTSATRWQTFVRDRIQRMLRDSGLRQPEASITSRMTTGNSYLLVPYAALDAAGIERSTMKPIDVTDDVWEHTWHQVKVPELRMPDEPPKMKRGDRFTVPLVDPKKKKPVTFTITQAVETVLVAQAQIDGLTLQTTWRRNQVYVEKGTKTVVRNFSNRYYALQRDGKLEAGQVWRWVGDWVATNVLWDGVSRQTALVQWGTHHWQWQQAERQRLQPDPNNGGFAVWVDSAERELAKVRSEEVGYLTREHHLGANLFSAVSADGKRHRFLSAFDAEEVRRLYFLAQLPNNSKAKTYDEALHALAPPIVHAAREQKRRVWRQGDVFAIETSLTDEDIYARARTRTRRQVVFGSLQQAIRNLLNTRSRVMLDEIAPAEGEVRERVDCPCGCGHQRITGGGPKAQAALSIYRTGHTATEVVVARNGATYVRGVMHHDPQLETPGRQAEHEDVNLFDESDHEKRPWCLTVRNTVPRRSTRRTTPTTT